MGFIVSMVLSPTVRSSLYAGAFYSFPKYEMSMLSVTCTVYHLQLYS
uniref:ORF46c n=1 Tax=Pinus thunbergii TaxID=3350 RepID=Q32942_PINTH|nr:ORF46c [Pinus thunbergii]